MSRFISFKELDRTPSGKTRRWEVLALENGDLLGRISWYGQWRCYAFMPASGCVFEKACLRDIAEFCEERTSEHRLQRRHSRDYAEAAATP